MVHKTAIQESAALLARVSTAHQEDNSSIDAQLHRCRQFSEQREYNLFVEKREVMSGTLVLARSDSPRTT